VCHKHKTWFQGFQQKQQQSSSTTNINSNNHSSTWAHNASDRVSSIYSRPPLLQHQHEQLNVAPSELKLRCDERFTHAFTACSCVFKVITLVGLNQGNYFENATACIKRVRKTLVATQLWIPTNVLPISFLSISFLKVTNFTKFLVDWFFCLTEWLLTLYNDDETGQNRFFWLITKNKFVIFVLVSSF